jgi:hypothetical protein
MLLVAAVCNNATLNKVSVQDAAAAAEPVSPSAPSAPAKAAASPDHLDIELATDIVISQEVRVRRGHQLSLALTLPACLRAAADWQEKSAAAKGPSPPVRAKSHREREKERNSEWKITGDSTDIALAVAAHRAGGTAKRWLELVRPQLRRLSACRRGGGRR